MAPEEPNYDDDPIERSLKERLESGGLITSIVSALKEIAGGKKNMTQTMKSGIMKKLNITQVGEAVATPS